MIMTTTTKITRQYLEHKTKSDLAQMYLDLLDDDIKLENAAKQVVEWEQEYRAINNLGHKAPNCFLVLRVLLGIAPEEPAAVPLSREGAKDCTIGHPCPQCSEATAPKRTPSDISKSDIDKAIASVPAPKCFADYGKTYRVLAGGFIEEILDKEE